VIRGVLAFLAGLLFAGGLAISGMTRPAKVIGFLDPLGGWDPSLALVMVGAIGVHALAYLVAARLPRPLVGEAAWRLPPGRPIDRRLVAGAVVFGVGWGLGGVCPGPALTAVWGGSLQMVVFVGAMVAGMGVFELWSRRAMTADG
jgi:uncharacterized protein